MNRRVAFIVGSVVWLVCAPALAQRTQSAPTPAAAGLAQRVRQLQVRLEDAQKAAADVPLALKALQDLQNRVTALAQQLQRVRVVHRNYPAVRSKIDGYEERLADLEMRLSAVTIQLAQRTVPDGLWLAGGARQRFSARVDGLLQVQYRSAVVSDPLPQTEFDRDLSGLSVRRARVGVSGYVGHARLSYRLLLGFGSIAEYPLLAGWGEVRIFDWIQLRAGRMRIPFTRQFLTSPEQLQFVDRSDAVRAMAPGRDIGLLLQGDAFGGRATGLLSTMSLTYQLGIFNGTADLEDNNTDFLYVGRVVLAPFGACALSEGDRGVDTFKTWIGGGVVYNLVPTDLAARRGITDPIQAQPLRDRDNDGEVDNVEVMQLSAELGARYRGLAWQGELLYRREDPGVSAETRSFWAVYGQLSYYYHPARLELAGRYGFVQPPAYGQDATVLRPAEIHEASGVVVFSPSVSLVKLSAQYTHQWLRDVRTSGGATGAAERVNRFMLQAQLGF